MSDWERAPKLMNRVVGLKKLRKAATSRAGKRKATKTSNVAMPVRNSVLNAMKSRSFGTRPETTTNTASCDMYALATMTPEITSCFNPLPLNAVPAYDGYQEEWARNPNSYTYAVQQSVWANSSSDQYLAELVRNSSPPL